MSETVLELRCPHGPRALLLKLRLGDEQGQVNSDNLMEISCRDCTRAARKQDPLVIRVLHRFDFTGELIESAFERASDG